MSRILHWRFCGKLSLMMAVCMILPVIAMAGTVTSSAQPVVISNTPGDYKISLGKGEDARVGTKGVISRDGKDLAKFEITSVEWGYSAIKLTDVNANETVLVGDGVRLTTVPPPAKIKSGGGTGKTLGFLLLVGALVALGSGGGGHGSSGGVQNVSLLPERTSMPADGTTTATITATIVGSGNAAVPDGTPVTFSASSGAITPAETTTTGGQATATLTSGATAGTCTVTAHAGGRTATTTISFVQSDQGSRGSIALAATPTTIQVLNSGGTATESTIVATCRDEAGALATSGTVTFSSTLGSVVGTADINPATGEATTTFSSGQTGNAQITAEWDGATADIAVKVTAGPPHSIIAECTPPAIECDGNSFATVKVTVTDIAGNPVTDGTMVDFTVAADVTGGGNGTVTPQAPTTSGEATALLFSRDSTGAVALPGTAAVTATVTHDAQIAAGLPAPAVDISNHETQVIFTSLDVAEMHVGANPLNIRGWDYIGETSTVTALVYDSHHNPVPDGTAVYFTADHGMIYGNAGMAGKVAMSTTNLGRAVATIVGDASGDPGWFGDVTITATSGNVSVSGGMIFSGPPDEDRTILAMAPTTLPSSQASATITIVVNDQNGKPVVPANTTIQVSATRGTLSTQQPKIMGGVATVTLSTSNDAANPTAAGDGEITVIITSTVATDPVVELHQTYTIGP